MDVTADVASLVYPVDDSLACCPDVVKGAMHSHVSSTPKTMLVTSSEQQSGLPQRDV